MCEHDFNRTQLHGSNAEETSGATKDFSVYLSLQIIQFPTSGASTTSMFSGLINTTHTAARQNGHRSNLLAHVSQQE